MPHSTAKSTPIAALLMVKLKATATNAPISIIPSIPIFIIPACSVINPPIAANMTGVAVLRVF